MLLDGTALSEMLCLMLYFSGFAAALQVVIPSTLKVFEMEKLNLTCNATDYAEGINLTFSWRKISAGSFSMLGSNLVLAPIRTDDGGEYECQVNADTFEMATGSVRIVVQCKYRVKCCISVFHSEQKLSS